MTPKAEAINLLEELGISALPINPREICHKLSIEYFEDSLKSIDGLLIINRNSGSSLIAVNATIPEQGRKNFTAAHELGHLCLDCLEQNEFYCSREVIDTRKPSIPVIELRANEFAAELLMPTHLYQDLVGNRSLGWDEIKELADISKTSLTSTAIRFIDLTEEACCFVLSQAGRMLWFKKSTQFMGYVQPGFLYPDTFAKRAFNGESPPDSFEVIKADNWLSGKGVTPQNEILEWSLPINSYGQVLTLLYDEEGIKGWDQDDEIEDDEDVEWEPPTFHKSKRKG